MTAALVQQNAAPQSMADVEAMYNSAWAQAHAHVGRRQVDTEERREPLELNPTMKYCFRTRPGGPRRPIIRIDAPDKDWATAYPDNPKGRGLLQLKTLWERRHAGDDPEWLATIEQAHRDNSGRDGIVFNTIDSNLEAWYQTNSDAIAAVIRRYMRSNDADARFYYEVFPDREIMVGDKRFPDTQTGRDAALTFMSESGGELKYVYKGTKKPYKASE